MALVPMLIDGASLSIRDKVSGVINVGKPGLWGAVSVELGG